MIPRSVLILTCAFAVGAAASAQQPQRDGSARPVAGGSTISGKVIVNGDARQPARRTRVTLNELSRAVDGQTTTTDDAGGFVFRGVPAGRFELKAVKTAYLTTSYGASRPERAGTPIVVKDGDRVSDLTVSIVRGGVIAGVVRDARGRPAASIPVRVLRFGFNASTGERTLASPSLASAGTTDDRGEYRAYGLSPGNYVVLVNPPTQSSGPGGLPDIRPLTAADVDRALQAARAGQASPGAATTTPLQTPAARVNYAPVFFPGVTDIASASTIALGLSEERNGVDVVIQYVPTATVSGTVSMPGGTLPQFLSLALVPSGGQTELLAAAGLRGNSTQVAADGSFSVTGVAPGAYTVKARGGQGSGRGGSALGPSVWANADVTVSGQDIAVSLILQPGINIAGHLVFEGSVQPTPAELQTLAFRLVPAGAGGQPVTGRGGQVDAEGRFSFTGLAPDTYRVLPQWSGPSAKWSIASSVANGRDSLDAPLLVLPAEANGGVDWKVTFTDKPTGVSGVFQDRSGRAATDYFVVVFPADQKYWTPGSRRIAMARPATDGAFSATGLAAGDYYVAALTDLEPGEWNEPQLLAQLVGSATKVTLRDGEITKQDLRVGLIGQRAEGKDQR